MRKIIFVAFIITFLAQHIHAQKNGCISRVEVLSAMPETMQANIEIAELRNAYQKQGEAMVAVLQDEYTRLQKLVSGGSSFSKGAMDKEVAKLKAKEKEIYLFEEEMKLTLQDRKSDLFKPLNEKLNSAISEVANENGMDVIYDKGAEWVLYAEQGSDITSKVKIKLGL